jgi:hypothetical protein
VHIRCIGDWTNALAKALGADFDVKLKEERGVVGGQEGRVVQPASRVLPRIMIDG